MQYVLENAVINVGYNKDLRTAEKERFNAYIVKYDEMKKKNDKK